MAKSASQDLPVIQKTYDLIRWYVPILNRLPRNHRFTLGERMINRLYDLLEGFILARYSRHKLEQLEQLNVQIDLLRHQNSDGRLLHETIRQSLGRGDRFSKPADSRSPGSTG